jgi:hypothetical protein
MSLRASSILVSLLLCACLADRARASEDAFNLGMLGAEGIPVERDKFKDQRVIPEKAVGIRVTSVTDEGAAKKADLRVGDVIIAADKAFLIKQKDAVYRLIEHLDAAAAKQDAKAELTVLRDDKPVSVKVQLESLGKHSATCPVGCERCDRQIKQSLDYLAGKQGADGGFEINYHQDGKVVVTAVAGLAFLASGSTITDGPYAKNIKGAVEYLIAKCGRTDPRSSSLGKDNFDQTNWGLGYSGIFLSEVYKKTPSADVKKKLEEVAEALAKNQEMSGGWGHGPGGTNPLGYVELEIVGNWCMAALGTIKQAGIRVSDGAVKKGTEYIVACGKDNGGGIAYSTRPNQKNWVDVGRTSGAIFAFAMLGQKGHALYKQMARFFDSNMGSLPNGHSSPVMHFMQGALACCHLEPVYRQKFMEIFRPEWLASRRADGSMTARPLGSVGRFDNNKGNSSVNADREIGITWTTANYLVAMQLPKGNLALCCGSKNK